MKPVLLLTALFFVVIACSTKKTEEQATDSVDVLKIDSASSNFAVVVEYEIKNQEGLISDPFNFNLDSAELTEILGLDTEFRVEDYEGTEAYPGYSITTVIHEESELSYYSYPGKHSAAIFTSRLPLKNGIQVGMSKAAFLQVMKLPEADASKATEFNIIDDYGQMSFVFRGDTLYSIFVFYEEGD